jgi:Na+/proline symporter
MLCVGLGITIFFHQNKLPESVSYLQNAGQDGIFPYFVANHIPVGLSGLIIAGMFASGISTLDSALTALSQTTVMGIRKSLANTEIIKSSELLRKSRHFVGIWGIIMLVITISLWQLTKKSDTGLLDIGLQVPGFVYGSLLGLALLAIRRHKGWKSAFIGAIVACVFTIFLWIVNVSFFWWYPVASIVTFGVAYLLNKMFKI